MFETWGHDQIPDQTPYKHQKRFMGLSKNRVLYIYDYRDISNQKIGIPASKLPQLWLPSPLLIGTSTIKSINGPSLPWLCYTVYISLPEGNEMNQWILPISHIFRLLRPSARRTSFQRQCGSCDRKVCPHGDGSKLGTSITRWLILLYKHILKSVMTHRLIGLKIWPIPTCLDGRIAWCPVVFPSQLSNKKRNSQ